MTTSKEAQSAVEEALRMDDLEGLIRGDYPYSISEEYMAPSTVPTNWSSMIRHGLEAAVAANPAMAKQIEDALVSLVNDAEGIYCSLAFLSTYLAIQSRRQIFSMDVKRISDAIRGGIATREPEIRAFLPSWIHPSEDIWERVVRLAELMKDDHGVSLRESAAVKADV